MRILLFFVLVIIFFSCNKEDEEPQIIEQPPKSYMKNMIEPDTVNAYTGEYYIRAILNKSGADQSKELEFNETIQNMTVWYKPSSANFGMSSQGVVLSDSGTDEQLIVHFYFNTESDSLFTLAYADYKYANPWKNIEGINIEYYRPVLGSPNSSDLFMGDETGNSFFEITFIGVNRINGRFQTRWTGRAGSNGVYDVYGDFSIPIIKANIVDAK
ncbi:hypothetical protein [uncultured Draconibacterium sp.]|uniref:hypothetical protein n=1 Tax=uncultured Draconibacterium sp. TaxID=1573823 RepID=UPI002AA92BAD|nr:hypothetical protein [uncultured Draconibacterium sp.]